ncbi:hypothetical protein [Streptomyces sp. NPDC048644]|uniref:hypothetical protein n=1 Tax=Streptomyces sp. NPDC048644 TaxID=3365582 RepID=UPI003720C228
MFLPVPLVAVTAFALDSRVPEFETTSVRPVPRFDATLVLTTLIVVLSFAMAADSSVLICVARNTAFLIGLLLLARPAAGQAAVMTSVGWIAIVVFFSRRPWPDPDPWTILPEPSGALHAAGASLGVLALGILTHLRFSREDR